MVGGMSLGSSELVRSPEKRDHGGLGPSKSFCMWGFGCGVKLRIQVPRFGCGFHPSHPILFSSLLWLLVGSFPYITTGST
jgi:hypothetical protein